MLGVGKIVLGSKLKPVFILQLNSTGILVEKLQRILNLEVTGKYDNITSSAVKNFQAKNDLDMSGFVDHETYISLFESAPTEDQNQLIKLMDNMNRVTAILKNVDTDLYELSILLQKYIRDFVENANLK